MVVKMSDKRTETLPTLLHNLQLALYRISSNNFKNSDESTESSSLPWACDITGLLHELEVEPHHPCGKKSASKRSHDHQKYISSLFKDRTYTTLFNEIFFLNSISLPLHKIPTSSEAGRWHFPKCTPERNENDEAFGIKEGNDSAYYTSLSQTSMPSMPSMENTKLSAAETVVNRANGNGSRCRARAGSQRDASDLGSETARDERREPWGEPMNCTAACDITANSVLQSLRSILSVLCDEPAKSQAAGRVLVAHDAQKRKAARSVLEFCRVWEREKGSAIFSDVIAESVEKVFEEIIFGRTMRAVHSWMRRLSVVLEFCDSLEICTRVIEFLIGGLDVLGKGLLNATCDDFESIYSQIRVLFHGLYISACKFVVAVEGGREKWTRQASPEVSPLERSSRWRNRMKPCNCVEPWRMQNQLYARTKAWTSVLQRFSCLSTVHSPALAILSLKLFDILSST